MPITNLAIERRNLKELKQMFVHYDNISVEPSYDGSYEDFNIYGKVFDRGIFVLLEIHGWKIMSVRIITETHMFTSLESKEREANRILLMRVFKKRSAINIDN